MSVRTVRLGNALSLNLVIPMNLGADLHGTHDASDTTVLEWSTANAADYRAITDGSVSHGDSVLPVEEQVNGF